MIPENITPDWAARKILIASYLYYVQNHSIMTDHEYDQLSIIAADGWEHLHPCRQFLLGDPTSTKAGGSHFKYSSMVIGAALAHSIKNNLTWNYPVPDAKNWLFNESVGRYITVAGGKPKKTKKTKNSV